MLSKFPISRIFEKCTFHSTKCITAGYYKIKPHTPSQHKSKTTHCQQQESTTTKPKMLQLRTITSLKPYNWNTVPNWLCVIRIAITPVIGWLVLQESYSYACTLFILAGITDLADGLIARNYPGQQSQLGSILDPLADKCLIAVLFATLTYVQIIPIPVTALVLCRDLCLVAGGFVLRYRSLKPPLTLGRFFDPGISPIRIVPSKISKFNTVLQLLFVSASLASPVFDFVGHPALLALQYLTLCTTVYSGVAYAFNNGILQIRVKGPKRKHF